VQHVRRAHLFYVLAKIQQRGNDPLPVHDAADAQGIAHALVHAVFKGYLHVRFKPLKRADSDAVDYVVGVPQSLPAVGGGLDNRSDTVGVQVPLAKRRYHGQVIGVDVRKGDLRDPQFGHGHDVRQQVARKTEAPRPNKANFHK
jgi:hypothetical protein